MTVQKLFPAAMLPRKTPKTSWERKGPLEEPSNSQEPRSAHHFDDSQPYPLPYTSSASSDLDTANPSSVTHTIPYRSENPTDHLSQQTYHDYYGDVYVNSIPQSVDEDSTDSVYSDLSGVPYGPPPTRADLSSWGLSLATSDTIHNNFVLPGNSYLGVQSSASASQSHTIYSSISPAMSTVSAPTGYLFEQPTSTILPQYHEESVGSTPSAKERFRFNCTLDAPSSTDLPVKESSITYLNKAEAYSMFIEDTRPDISKSNALTYRTWIHLAFNDEEQRTAKLASWQTWQRRRPNSDHRSKYEPVGAVELIDSCPKTDRPISTSIQLIQERFDAFCIHWTPRSTETPILGLTVRLNFLSTDFSDNKGVKGANVRLYATNEIVNSADGEEFSSSFTESCYCLIKTFRRFGAERKRKADVSRAEKDYKRGKVSVSRSPPVKREAEDSRQRRYSSANDKTTHRNLMPDLIGVTVLHLQGHEEDDPNRNTVSLDDHAHNAAGLSQSQGHVISEGYELGTTGRPIKPKIHVGTPNSAEGGQSPHFEAMQPPTPLFKFQSRAVPVACFFIRIIANGKQAQDDCYRAIYLTERSLQQFVQKTADKCGIDAAQVTDVIRIGPRGMHITVDDGVIEYMPENQSLTAVFENILPSKHEGGEGNAQPLKHRLVIWY